MLTGTTLREAAPGSPARSAIAALADELAGGSARQRAGTREGGARVGTWLPRGRRGSAR
jgi:hypothetical protein